ncbi:hypothetical protein BC830DRAFT_1154065 [Chytriomyces sp. MP71]|nr:hypothetical protein BC830DRAFT_1154065 [Chytriomyces sp. MP71]
MTQSKKRTTQTNTLARYFAATPVFGAIVFVESECSCTQEGEDGRRDSAGIILCGSLFFWFSICLPCCCRCCCWRGTHCFGPIGHGVDEDSSQALLVDLSLGPSSIAFPSWPFSINTPIERGSLLLGLIPCV